MKKASSSASYSEFRKKNPNLKETPNQAGLSQIELLSKQLEAINSKKTIQSSKYDHPNGILEEDEEDDLCLPNSNFKSKAQANSATKKLKVLTNKLELQPKAQPNKLNKSIQGHFLIKKEKEANLAKDSGLKNSVRLPKNEAKEEPRLTRRMSLTTMGKTSILSTNESISTSISQSQNPITKKKSLMEKLSGIEAKIQTKSIPPHLFQEIMEKVDKIQQILEEC